MSSRDGSKQRRYISSLMAEDGTIMNLKSPILALGWSFMFPGLGHYYVGKTFLGLMLVAWEFIINNLANINLCIYYSLIGDFETAKQAANLKWFIAYGGIYIFCMWESYIRAVETNHVYLTVYKEDRRPSVFVASPTGENYLVKKNPWIAAFWGVFFPGLGAIYCHRMVSAIYALSWMSIAGYKSGFFSGVLYSLWGKFDLVKNTVDPQWLLFLPSIFAFTGYEGYSEALETNRLIKYEQANFLRDNYQSEKFKMPI